MTIEATELPIQLLASLVARDTPTGEVQRLDSDVRTLMFELQAMVSGCGEVLPLTCLEPQSRFPRRCRLLEAPENECCTAEHQHEACCVLALQ